MQCVAPLEPVAAWKGQPKPLPIDLLRAQACIERNRLRHETDVERAIEEKFAEPRRNALDNAYLDSRMTLSKLVQESDKADWADRAHHAESQRCCFQLEEASRDLLRVRGAVEDLFQMWPHQTAKIRELDVIALTTKQVRPKLRLQFLNRPRECRLRHMALRCSLVEVQGLAGSKKVSDLVHLHGLFP